MNRRSAVKNFLFFSGAVMALPSCWQSDTQASILLKNIRVSGDQERMLAELTEAILPTTQIPGARSLSSHLFALMMIDDCFAKDAQEKFTKGLQAFDEFARKEMGGQFVKAAPAERAGLLKSIESKSGIPEEVAAFYHTIKRLTIQSFTGSKYFLTTIRRYDMVPGRFHGCFPVANAK